MPRQWPTDQDKAELKLKLKPKETEQKLKLKQGPCRHWGVYQGLRVQSVRILLISFTLFNCRRAVQAREHIIEILNKLWQNNDLVNL